MHAFKYQHIHLQRKKQLYEKIQQYNDTIKAESKNLNKLNHSHNLEFLFNKTVEIQSIKH